MHVTADIRIQDSKLYCVCFNHIIFILWIIVYYVVHRFSKFLKCSLQISILRSAKVKQCKRSKARSRRRRRRMKEYREKVPQSRIAEMTRLKCQFIIKQQNERKRTRKINVCIWRHVGVLVFGLRCWGALLFAMQCEIYRRFCFEPVSVFTFTYLAMHDDLNFKCHFVH